MTKAALFRFLFIVLISFSFSNGFTQIEVCKTCPIKTIKEGIKQAKPHQKVIIKAGVYKEHMLIIDKPLTLITTEKATIDGENQGDIIQIFADSVTIDGFQIIHVGSSHTTDYSAIRVDKAAHFLIQNLELRKIFFGVMLAKAKHGTITNIKVYGDAVQQHNSGNAIHLWHSHHILIDKNELYKSRDGIYLEFSDDCIISNNISRENIRYGLHFMFSNRDEYRNNTFENNGAGVAVMFSKKITMIDNHFQYNWGSASYGLLLKEINDAEIIGNTFQENTIGINVEGSNRINYKNNDFRSNGWAIKVNGACYNNVFIQNNFLYNSFDVSYNSKMNNNSFNENFWSGYTGYDLDKDGLGDIPYRPVKLFSYVVNRTPNTIILMRSLFVDIIDFSESVSPAFTPDNLMDERPLMKQVK
ncbi:nitrous oxide reductase family maturation protein NosD [Brumimicrobium oceani]|uniref:Nitrous oxide reductase family maturation protein NosD n=1 Tax=Brumimicrobium oceani TaxID=2100725 RepID=A0A2U2X0L3_9FLAO|nr:nitrous oxide reductase family maturation protein NosD [Brumimicrobium oceani]PWH81317.1 nitrous oxide reductase family maturation protein NosD [Brumimicrobium oceani]